MLFARGIQHHHFDMLRFFLQLSFLACFFWLNVMCFDIWWTFRGCRLAERCPGPRPGSNGAKRRFMWYSLYAWGCSLFLVGLTLTLYLVPNVPKGLLLLRPLIGQTRCYFETFQSKATFFLGPVSVLIAANVALFTHTAWRLAQLKRETAALKTADSQRHSEADRQRFILYLKLFLVMGLNWVAELLSTYFPSVGFTWVIFDVCNTLQGIFIFVMFVCKKRVWRLLKGRFSKKRRCHRSSGSGSNFTATTDITVNGSSLHSSKRSAKLPSTESTSQQTSGS